MIRSGTSLSPRYVALNPAWRSSTAIPCLVPVSPGEIARFLGSAVQRLLRP